MSCDVSNDMCCCKNVLELDKLCAKCAKICWLKAKKVWADEIHANEVCSQKVLAKDLWSETEVVNDLCAQSVKSHQMQAGFLNANSLCAQSGNMDSLCVNNLQVQNLMNCNRFRATVVLSADTFYTLGSSIEWDTILDDPNGNVAVGPFSYTVPKTGYYSVAFHLDTHGLTGANIIAGIPVATLELEVNGLEFRDALSPFLSFNPSQTAILSTQVILNAGDVVKTKYRVRVVDPTLGVIDYVGTSILEGNGAFPSQSSFGIILLSEICTEQPSCQPCPPVEILCQPFEVPCMPVVPPHCDPCDQPSDMEHCQRPEPTAKGESKAAAMPGAANADCVPCQPASNGESLSDRMAARLARRSK